VHVHVLTGNKDRLVFSYTFFLLMPKVFIHFELTAHEEDVPAPQPAGFVCRIIYTLQLYPAHGITLFVSAFIILVLAIEFLPTFFNGILSRT